MKKEEPKGIRRHWQFSINTIKGEVQNLKFETRNDAQIAVDNKRVFGEINVEEWNRLTDLLSTNNVGNE